MKAAAALTLIFVAAAACAALIVSETPAADPPPPPTARELELEAKLARARRYARRLEARARLQATRAERLERALARTRHAIRAGRITSPLGNHWLESAFACIHRFEGRWADPHPPYWGGLQMSLDFQRAYGAPFLAAFGTADRWPRSVQMAVAIRGYLARGFQPWPTRRFCGL